MLRALFSDIDGTLQEGVHRHSIDEVTIQEPWSYPLDEIIDVLECSESRHRLCGHLIRFVDWFENAWAHDDQRDIWIRGDFGSTLWPEVDELELVVQYGPTARLGDLWVLQVFGMSHSELHPGRLTVTPLLHTDPEHEFARDQEARRSRVRVRDPRTGNALATGWLRIDRNAGGGAR